MSTRSNIQIYDGDDRRTPGAMLYHHSDGYPEFMEGKLRDFLIRTSQFLTVAGYPYWWDSERVASIMIMLSIEDYREPLLPFSTNRPNTYSEAEKLGVNKHRPNAGVPVFVPCLKLHDDIEYLYKVYLGEKLGDFEIKYKHL